MSTTVQNTKVLTLCFLRDGGRVLLGMKKRGFGAGRWNGFGGKVEAGETIEDAAKRECREEAGVDVERVAKRGILHFVMEDDPVRLAVHVYEATQWTGEPVETDEMRPAWHSVDALPFDAMWPDDRYWLPAFLAGHVISGTFYFRGENEIVHWYLETSDRWTNAIGIPAWEREMATPFARRLVN